MTAPLIAAAAALLTITTPDHSVTVRVPMDSMAQCQQAAQVARRDFAKAGQPAIVTCTEGV